MNPLRTLDDWIDYYIQQIPAPLILHWRGGKIVTYKRWNTCMGAREYYRRLYKGEYEGGTIEQGRVEFQKEMIAQKHWLFKFEIWKKKKYTKKYYLLWGELAPICEGGCGRKVLGFSPWGERNPFLTMCSSCEKQLRAA
jgi:hypothetical protein